MEFYNYFEIVIALFFVSIPVLCTLRTRANMAIEYRIFKSIGIPGVYDLTSAIAYKKEIARKAAEEILRAKQAFDEREQATRKAEEDRKEKAKKTARAKAEEKERTAKREAKKAAEEILNAKKKQEEVEEAKEVEKRKFEKEQDIALDKLTNKLLNDLPFYRSSKLPSDELENYDRKRWHEIKEKIKSKDSTPAKLYFVKIKSLLDDTEYHKIGITTKSVESRFEKSTQVELLQVINYIDIDLWLAEFLEYQFLREFRIYDALEFDKPNVPFSGSTEVVRSNSVNKISGYFDNLSSYRQYTNQP